MVSARYRSSARCLSVSVCNGVAVMSWFALPWLHINCYNLIILASINLLSCMSLTVMLKIVSAALKAKAKDKA